MMNENMLKSSVFGGYKKKDVIEYIDSVLEESDKKKKDFEDQIESLRKENKDLKSRFPEAKEKSGVISGEKKSLEYTHETQEKRTQILSADISNSEKREGLSLRQQMQLPEGTYLITEKNGIINLPEPSPVYRTKGQNPIFDSVAGIKQDTESVTQVSAEAAATEQIEKGMDMQDSKIEAVQKTDGGNLREEEPVLEQKDQPAGSSSNLKAGYKAEMTSREAYLLDRIAEIRAELISTKELLTKEKQEKQTIEARLEYSNNLLLQLYKK